MSTINKVAVVGGSGNLGTHVVQALLDANFIVTVVTRKESTATFPAVVAVKRADLTSTESVKDAFAGQDAVVSVTAIAAGRLQRGFIDAAIAARVPRFMPSEFGISTRMYRDTKIGTVLATKTSNTDYLIELAQKHKWFSWTGISTGLFLDKALSHGPAFLDLKNRKARIVDSGAEPFTTSTLPFVGRAVAVALQRPAETANKYLNIVGRTTTQNEVLAIAEEFAGAKFAVSHINGAELEAAADEKLAKHDYSAFSDLLEQHLYADGAGHALRPEENANSLLGLEEEDLRKNIEAVIKMVEAKA